jgi:hypothetical protein
MARLSRAILNQNWVFFSRKVFKPFLNRTVELYTILIVFSLLPVVQIAQEQ